MLQTRIIPALLLRNDALVKTIKFKNGNYIGDPVNTVRIFNELEVDELVFLDISATNEGRKPNFKILKEIADECFMPLAYGGGINNFEDVKTIFNIGFEKVILNSITFKNPQFITEVASHFGNQAIVVSIDVKKNIWGNYDIYSHSGKVKTNKNLKDWVIEVENLGAGEILITSIDKEGTWLGFDINLIKSVCKAVNIPVVAHGGAGSFHHISEVLEAGNISAVAIGSMFVYQQKGMGVLINYPKISF